MSSKPLKIFTSLILFGSLPFLFRALGLFAFSLGFSSAEQVEFNRDIRPILSDNCYTCHGPDKANRKTNLRLDNETSVYTDLGGYQAVVPGNPEKSELYLRISSEDESRRMPPVYSERKLSASQIALVRRWIEQGAQWQKHWSFIPPVQPSLPEVKTRLWVRNPIDFFVLERLEREGLTPSPEAPAETLLRRVTLDLTGLPPSLKEIDAFLSDHSPNAYEKLVDRLLQSPRYGERMAIRWLEAARYADTNGYQTDAERIMWRWRDWVIDAFNRNLPFDQFTVEQIAGDLLPNATLEQKLATGFNRNHRGNGEGGIIAEEYAVEYVVDRVDTTATVWLGLTMGCARCHDHKYDPFTQKEYYQLFSYFNNIPERGHANKYGNSPPMIKTPTPQQQLELSDLNRGLEEAEKQWKGLQPEFVAAEQAWEKSFNRSRMVDWSMTDGLETYFPLDGNTIDRVTKPPNEKAAPPSFRDGNPDYVRGQIGLAADFDGKRFIDAGNVAEFGFYDKFSMAAWIYPLDGKGGAIFTRTKDLNKEMGYGLYLFDGKLQLDLVQRWLDDALRLETQQALSPGRWYHVTVSYDGSRTAEGAKIYVDGKPADTKVLLDELYQTFKTTEPFRIGGGGGPEIRFHGFIDDVRVYNRVLDSEEARLFTNTDRINEILVIPPEKRSELQIAKLRAFFVATDAPESIQKSQQRITTLRRQREKLIDAIPTTMVMQEMKSPRDTYLLIRGAYDRRGDRVRTAVPAALNPLPEGAPDNRLGLARWLVDPNNPLTARVAVNRFWQMYFGNGLVKTVENFGAQGDWPTHPALLDWMATEFVRSGWDVKALQKQIVMSATYRQSSRTTPTLLLRDPENRLLARGPRTRLSAEAVRDQALAISGLLVEKLGGQPVRPYQPEGLWKDLSGGEDYEQDRGENLYRRSLYTFWKRTVAPPAMITFDAPSRETCIVRQSRTNTPLQALNLMNDVTYVEAARVLAQRIMSEGGPLPEDRLSFAFRLATSRWPTSLEREKLKAGFQFQLDQFQKDPQLALRLISAGEYPINQKLDMVELAAYTTMASLILNLDQTISKE
jgi:hypothetical protein